MKQAVAYIFGGSYIPNIIGNIRFFDNNDGKIKITIDICGIMDEYYSLHIHENGICQEGDILSPFSISGKIFNANESNDTDDTNEQALPMLIPSDGRVKMLFLTNKFKIDSIIGRSVVMRRGLESYDAKSDTALGKIIACGIIRGVVSGKSYYSE